MKFNKALMPIVGVMLIAGTWRSYGWGGVAFVTGAMVMVVLLFFNHAMKVLGRAANRPVGAIGSAVMLSAKLKPRTSLLRVIAITCAIGESRSPEGVQPEVFRWTDASGAFVDATFANGKLTEWRLVQPEPPQP
jgi:hypothetical protein